MAAGIAQLTPVEVTQGRPTTQHTEPCDGLGGPFALGVGDWHQPSNRSPTSGDHQLFASLDPVEQLGEAGLCFECANIGHRTTSLVN